MNIWIKTKLAIVCLLAVALLMPAGVLASGYEYIGGVANNGSVKYYFYPRTVTYPPTSGPEVAFNESYESSSVRLFLGTHDCSASGWGPIYEQYIGSWQPVAYYSSAPVDFCMLTYGVSGSASFNGDLAWD